MSVSDLQVDHQSALAEVRFPEQKVCANMGAMEGTGKCVNNGMKAQACDPARSNFQLLQAETWATQPAWKSWKSC